MRRLVLAISLCLACACAASSKAPSASKPSAPAAPPPAAELARSGLAVVADASLRLTDPARQREIEIAVTYPGGAGKFPVILYSHGDGGNGGDARPLARFWATRGYVVLAPSHRDAPSAKNSPIRKPGRRARGTSRSSSTPCPRSSSACRHSPEGSTARSSASEATLTAHTRRGSLQERPSRERRSRRRHRRPPRRRQRASPTRGRKRSSCFRLRAPACGAGPRNPGRTWTARCFSSRAPATAVRRDRIPPGAWTPAAFRLPETSSTSFSGARATCPSRAAMPSRGRRCPGGEGRALRGRGSRDLPGRQGRQRRLLGRLPPRRRRGEGLPGFGRPREGERGKSEAGAEIKVEAFKCRSVERSSTFRRFDISTSSVLVVLPRVH